MASHDDNPPEIIDTRDTMLAVLIYPDGRCLISSKAKTADGATDHAWVAETLLRLADEEARRSLTETGRRRVPGVTVACLGCCTQVPVEEDRNGAWSFAPHPMGMAEDAPLCMASGKPHNPNSHAPKSNRSGSKVIGCVCGFTDENAGYDGYKRHIQAITAAS